MVEGYRSAEAALTTRATSRLILLLSKPELKVGQAKARQRNGEGKAEERERVKERPN
jgi:hypothetical protein